jgi:Ca-activated chloride channel family protein
VDEHLSLNTTIVLTPRRAGVVDGQDNTVEALVRVQAPDAPPGHAAQRPPQAIALVVDRSGSMSGQPLTEAKRCAEYVLSRLRPTDRLSLAQFDHRVQRLWPAEPVGDGTAQRAAIAAITSGGNTNLHGGWLDGAESLGDIAGDGLKRVILLSDGQANEGLTDLAEITAQCTQWAGRGITTSTYGLGRHFNEELMIAMARAGGGSSYYGDTAEDLHEPFERELELLGNLCLRELRMTAQAPDGVEVEVLNDLPRTEGQWHLSDLAWGAEAWAVLRLKASATSLPPLGSMATLLRVTVTGRTLGGEPVQLERAGLSVPVLSAGNHGALADDELVTRRLIELAAADALTRVRSAAARGNWAAVDRMLEAASRQFAGNEWVASILAAMRSIADSRERERAMKEMMYSSARLRDRLASRDEAMQFSIAADVDVPAFLRRKAMQGKASE